MLADHAESAGVFSFPLTPQATQSRPSGSSRAEVWQFTNTRVHKMTEKERIERLQRLNETQSVTIMRLQREVEYMARQIEVLKAKVK